MRKMKSLNFKSTINVIEHIIIQNGWEYYITDEKTEDDIVFALVMGYETELGYVSMDEIGPYIKSRTRKLTEVMPAVDWEWVK